MRNNRFRPDHPTVEAAFFPHFHSDPIDRQMNGEEEGNYRYGVYQEPATRRQALRTNGSILALKNGNAFTDGGLTVVGTDGIQRNFLCLFVCASQGMVYDPINGYPNGTDLYNYIALLKQWNPKLRCDMTMSYLTPWDERSQKLFQWLSVRR